MPQNIGSDHEEFRKIVSGKLREELKKYFRTGSIFRKRSKNGKISVTIPQIDLPHIVFGKQNEGIGVGPGKPGDVIDKDKQPGKGEPGKDPGDGIKVDVDQDEVLKLLKDELELPDMKPKANQTFEEVKIKYNSISKLGPNSLIHKRRTMLQAMKRLSASGQLSKKIQLPGYNEEIPVVSIINSDKRFRQYNEIKIPSSNAVIFFMRDGSGSMDKFKCDIVSDIAWWLDLYISKYYKKTEVVHIWHDTQAREVSEKDFYGIRYGGGTTCSSAFKKMNKIIKDRYNPIKWNIYGFYFGDGENFEEDNKVISKMMQKQLSPDVVNMLGQIEILHHKGWGSSLKEHFDKQIAKGLLPHIRNAEIIGENNSYYSTLPEEKRDEEIKRVIKLLLGKNAEQLQEEEKSKVTA